MAKRFAGRKNDTLLKWMRAVVFAGTTTWALTAMAFDPAGAAVGIGLGIGVLALMSTGIAVLAAVIMLALPILAADLVIGAAFVIVGFASVQYLSHYNGRIYLLITASFVGAAFGPAWAIPVLAGYLLGTSEGTVVALLACLTIEAAGIVGGSEALGPIVTGGIAPGVAQFGTVENLLGFGWVGDAISSLDPANLLDSFSGVQDVPLLLIQPVLWAMGAGVAGSLRKGPTDARRPLFGLIAAAAGTLTIAAGSMVALKVLGTEAAYSSTITAAITSVVLAVAYIGGWEYLFPPKPPRQVGAKPSSGLSSVESEDADVDELLRLIATAEEQLESKHTCESVVMITDMKSFSMMTEEDGSFLSAKAIQRHRDLLLPVIARHKGSGKSTGGDGLVAAFENAEGAVQAAADMQRTLTDHNAKHSTQREMSIRVGIAAGEVVLDKGGRPFIGTALNMAARVMDLGDGGQVLMTRGVCDAAGDIASMTYSHGMFSLKNIAGDTEVIELLWSKDAKPIEPGTQKK